jgi:hypothetical protein
MDRPTVLVAICMLPRLVEVLALGDRQLLLAKASAGSRIPFAGSQRTPPADSHVVLAALLFAVSTTTNRTNTQPRWFTGIADSFRNIAATWQVRAGGDVEQQFVFKLVVMPQAFMQCRLQFLSQKT